MRVGNLIYCTYEHRHYLIIAEIMFHGKASWRLLTDEGKLDLLIEFPEPSSNWEIIS